MTVGGDNNDDNDSSGYDSVGGDNNDDDNDSSGYDCWW